MDTMPGRFTVCLYPTRPSAHNLKPGNTMIEMTHASVTLNKDAFVTLMAEAYSRGMTAGHHTAVMKDDPEFSHAAVQQFTDGLSAMLAEPTGSPMQ